MPASRLLSILLFTLLTPLLWGRTPIRGDNSVEAEQMYQFVAAHNPDFDPAVAEAFFTVGQKYGIRGDIALCQAIIETGWFRFDNGTAVTPDRHNYCGLGVSRRGDVGCSFETVEQGVTAMIQHLYAYSCRKPLPKGEELIDPRFRYVERGSAQTWEALAGRWAANLNYGQKILSIYNKMLIHKAKNDKQNIAELEEATQEEATEPAGTFFD